MTTNAIFILSQDMVQKIGDALGETPTKIGAPIINEINRQIYQMTHDPAKFVAAVEAYLAPIKAKLVVPLEA